MEITIGRDATTQKLCITVDNQPHLTNVAVPKSVSRQHCKITIRADGTMILNNLNPNNVTFVNDIDVINKTVTRDDRIALGRDHYMLNWTTIDAALPKVADIRPLRKVWNTYNEETKAIARSTQRFQVIRSVLPVFTMSAVLIGYLSGGKSSPFYLMYAIVIALTIFFSLKAWRDIDKNDKKRDMIKERFQQDYCCPCDGYFFGFTDYNVLVKNYDSCPKCKTKLKK